jgi:hypothetical protein
VQIDTIANKTEKKRKLKIKDIKANKINREAMQ